MGLYLKHVCVFIMAVLHHHRVVPGQCVGDAVLAFTVHSLKYNKKTHYKHATCCDTILNIKDTYFNEYKHTNKGVFYCFVL